MNNKCQYPVCEMHPCGPFACDKPAHEKRGEWAFCPQHINKYDKENNSKGEEMGEGLYQKYIITKTNLATLRRNLCCWKKHFGCC